MSSARALREQRALGDAADLADEADALAIDVRGDLALEERLLAGLDDPGQDERHAGGTGRRDRAVRALLGSHPPDPQQVVVLVLAKRPRPHVDRVRDRAQSVRAPTGADASCARLMPTSAALCPWWT